MYFYQARARDMPREAAGPLEDVFANRHATGSSPCNPDKPSWRLLEGWACAGRGICAGIFSSEDEGGCLWQDTIYTDLASEWFRADVKQ